jgi:hypothetical protein
MDHLIDWLAAHMPPDDGRVSLVHGDFRIDNMIFAKDAPRLLAVLDWELSTLGHPFADLAYQCMQWRLPNAGDFRGLAGLNRAALGLPSDEDYIAAYCRRTGIDGVPHWPFLIAFSFFRIAAIVQGVYKRALDGNASNPERGFKMGAAVPLMAQLAVADGRGGFESAVAALTAKAEGADRVLLQDQRPDLRLERGLLEIGDPAVRADEREIRAEQHFLAQLAVGVLDDLRREIFGHPAAEVDVDVRFM